MSWLSRYGGIETAVHPLPIPPPSRGREIKFVPSPLEGEGWGGGYVKAPDYARPPLARSSAGAGVALTCMGIEQALAQAYRFGRHLHQFILLDIGDRPFERERARRRQPDHLVMRMRAKICELLRLQRVDLEIGAARVLADDHTGINRRAGRNEQGPALLEIPQGIGDGRTLGIGDEHAVAPAL